MRVGRPLAGCTHRLRYAQDEKDVEHESGLHGFRAPSGNPLVGGT
jgi:hypothetical protein